MTTLRGRDERGAVAPFVALLLVVVLLAAALVVDLGLQRVGRTDMQSLSDVVAMDIARELDGRTKAELQPLVDGASGLAAKSVARNVDTVGEAPDLVVELGAQADDADGFASIAMGDPVTAVKVTSDTDVAFAFAGITGIETGSVSRYATATVSSGACFRLGSITATIDTADSALLRSFGSLVGDALGVKLDAVSYQGLADTFISLGDLATELGVGTVEELVALRSLAVAEFLSATSRVLARSGASDAAVDAALLGGLASRVSSTLRFDVADILSVGGTTALTAQAGVLDLLTASAFAVNGENLLDTGVVWNEPHVSTGNVSLKLIESPKQACGLVGPGTEAGTAQVQLDADLGFNLPNRIAGLDVRNITDPSTKAATIQVRARLGGASGYLSGLRCGDGTAASPEEIRTMVTSRLSDASVSLPFRLSGAIDTKSVVRDLLGSDPLNLGGLITPLVSVELSLDLRGEASASLASPASGPRETVYAVPPHSYGEGEPVPGSGPVQLPYATSSIAITKSTARLKITALGVLPVTVNVDVGTLNLGSILTGVANSVIGTSTNAVIDNVNEVLRPVSTLLGVRTGGADLFGIPRPSCAVPRLSG